MVITSFPLPHYVHWLTWLQLVWLPNSLWSIPHWAVSDLKFCFYMFSHISHIILEILGDFANKWCSVISWSVVVIDIIGTLLTEMLYSFPWENAHVCVCARAHERSTYIYLLKKRYWQELVISVIIIRFLQGRNYF